MLLPVPPRQIRPRSVRGKYQCPGQQRADIAVASATRDAIIIISDFVADETGVLPANERLAAVQARARPIRERYFKAWNEPEKRVNRPAPWSHALRRYSVSATGTTA